MKLFLQKKTIIDRNLKLFDGEVQLKEILEERLNEMNLQAKTLDNRM